MGDKRNMILTFFCFLVGLTDYTAGFSLIARKFATNAANGWKQLSIAINASDKNTAFIF